MLIIFSYGHKITNPEQFVVYNAQQFKEELAKKRNVIYDQEERKKTITEQVNVIAQELDATPILDSVLLTELVYIAEYPVVLVGNILDDFLKLPQAILTTSMKKHQRYIPLLDKKQLLTK